MATVPGFSVPIPSPDSVSTDVSLLTAGLQTAVAQFRTLVTNAGGSFTVMSTYRPPNYQAHLYEIRQKFIALNAVQGIDSTVVGNRPQLTIQAGTPGVEEAALVDQVNAEINRHLLRAGTLDHAPPVSNPANGPGVARHTSIPAEAVDISIGGLTSARIGELAGQAGLTRPHLADDPVHFKLGGAQDVAFVIDTTGSMDDDIDAVRAAAQSIVTETAHLFPSYRIGIVGFKDQGDSYVARTLLPFTNDEDQIRSAINAISVGGGGDTPESVFSGLIQAIDARGGLGGWRNDPVDRSIILFGDAPPKDPEPGTGFTYATVSSKASEGGVRISSLGRRSVAAKAVQPISITTLAIGDDEDTIAAYARIAAENHGRAFKAADAAEVVPGLIRAIRRLAVAPPTATIVGPADILRGLPTTFSLGLSYPSDPEVPPPAAFSIDWDGDGVVDQTLTAEDGTEVSHVYDVGGTYTIRLTATDADGDISEVSTRGVNVAVDEAGPRVVGVVGVTPRRGATQFLVTFNEPVDPAVATDVARYRLHTAGRDRRFGTRDDKFIAIRSASYDPILLRVTLLAKKRLPKLKHGLDIPGDIVDRVGNQLDGNADGTGGDGFTAIVRVRRSLRGLSSRNK